MKLCPKCGGEHDRRHRYCADCFAAYMREWRKTNPLSAEAKQKNTCRAYTNVLIKRGHLIRQPCSECGTEPAQAHHPDYSKPRLVIWLCKLHHRAEHVKLTQVM